MNGNDLVVKLNFEAVLEYARPLVELFVSCGVVCILWSCLYLFASLSIFSLSFVPICVVDMKRFNVAVRNPHTVHSIANVIGYNMVPAEVGA